MWKKLENYFKKNPTYNSVVHLIIGIGVGILVTYPYVGAHPLRWGVLFLVVGLVLHLYPWWSKK
jgi:hypothetical protein